MNAERFKSSYVRVEVGTAHRCVVDEPIHLNNPTLIMYLTRFFQGAPVGGAHL